VRRRVDGDERVALISLDAFGLEFLERHRDHPLIERLEVTPVRTQFPSTTTAHVTTVHFGVPVHEHGLYEWNVLEPALGALSSSRPRRSPPHLHPARPPRRPRTDVFTYTAEPGSRSEETLTLLGSWAAAAESSQATDQSPGEALKQ
jgi:hypothetical protein